MNQSRSAFLGPIHTIRHAFFGRQGGVSEGVYASLNCGSGSQDSRDAVTENRNRCASALDAQHLLSLYQIHSAQAVIVETPWALGLGPQADAMVTRVPGIALGVLAADCAPVLFADEAAGVIGAAHAGWKGAHGGVLEAAIETMESLGAERTRIVAAIGPCISQDAYEVGPEFFDAITRADPETGRFFEPAVRSAHWQFDLAGYVAARLETAGLAAIDILGECTYAQEAAYFSYRRTTHRKEPDYGRNLSAIVLR